MSKEYTRIYSTIGSIPVLGPILLFDDFSNGLLWTEIGTSGDTIFKRVINTFFTNSVSLHLRTRLTSAASGDNIAAQLKSHILPSLTYSITIVFRSPDLSLIDFFSIQTYFYSGTFLYNPDLRYEPSIPQWSYFDSSLNKQSIPGATTLLQDDTWHRITFSFNLSTSEYISLLINGESYPLTNIKFRKSSNTTPQHLRTKIILLSNSATPPEAYIDSVLIISSS